MRLCQDWPGVVASFTLVTLLLTYADGTARGRIQGLIVTVGTWPYSIYLLHNLVLGLVAPLVRRLGLPAGAHFLLVLCIVVPVTVVLSSVVYRRLEKPFIDVGRRFQPSVT